MSKTYLLDTNIWSRWFDQNKQVEEEIERLDPSSVIGMSVIVWGEIMYGAKINPEFDYASYSKFIRSCKPVSIPVDRHVSEKYGELRSRLFGKFSNRKLRTKIKRPEQLIDPVTSKELEIDENDLWLVSQALANNLVFVTNDRMKRIFDIVPKELECEFW